MMSPTRFLIQVAADWLVRISGPNGPIGEPRLLRRTQKDSDYGAFPLPPAAELPLLAGEDHHALCANDDPAMLRECYERISMRDFSSKEILPFGRYLFDTLIGRTAWRTIVTQSQATEVIELALSFPKNANILHQLNWEMICRPQACLAPQHPNSYGFIVDGYPKTVAITRIVTEAKQQAPVLHSPPRLLFVVGSNLTEFGKQDIRPGAEYLALLRNVKRNGRAVHSRILFDATAERLRQRVKEFQPDIVYFVCHGNMDEKGGYLELPVEQKENERRWYSDRILYNLDMRTEQRASEQPRYPSIVVLSACQSGTLLCTHEMGPLAANLVAGGIPIVVGMAGRISDLACLLFTQGFGSALVDGQPLVTATALGRTAALHDGKLVDESVDWALPTLFLANGIPPAYQPYEANATDPSCEIEKQIGAYGADREPVFCARNDFFEDYYDLMDAKSALWALAAYTETDEPGLGRTRLLQELATYAVREGHVPCLVTKNIVDKIEYPTNLLELAHCLFAALSQAYVAFGKVSPILTQLRLLATKSPAELKDHSRLNKKIRDELEFGQELTPAMFRLAAESDVRDLLQTIYPNAAERAVSPNAHQLLLLLDTVDQYGHGLIATLLDKLLPPPGIGGYLPIRVIFTFSNVKAAREILGDYVLGKKYATWLRLRPLKPFVADYDEDMLVYKRVLLDRYRYNRVPLAFNDGLIRNPSRTDPVAFMKETLRDFLGGIPGKFDDRITMKAVQTMGKREGVLVEADDELLFRALKELQNNVQHTD